MNRHDNDNLSRLSALNGYRVSEDDPDPRGWTLVTEDGQRLGEVTDLLVDTNDLKVAFFEVRLEGALSDINQTIVPADALDVTTRRGDAILLDESALHQSSAAASFANDAHAAAIEPDAQRLTRSEEELRIGTREVQRGEVVVNKSVESEHVSTPVTRRVERVRVERRPVSGDVSATPTLTEAEIRVPIIEEEVVVEKRAVVKEEIVVTRDVATETETVTADLRKERVHVEGEELTGNVASIEERRNRG